MANNSSDNAVCVPCMSVPILSVIDRISPAANVRVCGRYLDALRLPLVGGCSVSLSALGLA